MHWLRRIGTFGAAVAVAILLMTIVLPWLAAHGYAGSVVQRNYQQNIDATPLFYTDSERTMEILGDRLYGAQP